MFQYSPEVKEHAYELYMIQAMKVEQVVRVMQEDYPKFSHSTLIRWAKDKELAPEVLPDYEPRGPLLYSSIESARQICSARVDTG